MKTLAIETIQEKTHTEEKIYNKWMKRAFVKGRRNLKSYNTGVIGIHKRGRAEKCIWRNNGLEHSKFDENYKPKDQSNWTNSEHKTYEKVIPRYPWKKSYDKPKQGIKKQRHYFANKGPYSFFSSNVWIWELDHKEGWGPNNWCFRTVVLRKILESPLNSKEIKPVNPKGNQPWYSFKELTDGEAEALILWPLDVKSWLNEKDPDVGKDWGQGQKGKTEDEMVGWHHWLNGPELEQTLGDSEEWASLVCCISWGHKVEHDCDWTPTTILQSDCSKHLMKRKSFI